jgi:hypothetical protein
MRVSLRILGALLGCTLCASIDGCRSAEPTWVSATLPGQKAKLAVGQELGVDFTVFGPFPQVKVASYDKAALRLVSESPEALEQKPDPATGKVLATGALNLRFTFQALKAGQTEIVMEVRDKNGADATRNAIAVTVE